MADNFYPSTSLTFTDTNDANGRVTKVGYDALGHVVETVDAAGNVTQFTYQHDLLAKIVMRTATRPATITTPRASWRR